MPANRRVDETMQYPRPPLTGDAYRTALLGFPSSGSYRAGGALVLGLTTVRRSAIRANPSVDRGF